MNKSIYKTFILVALISLGHTFAKGQFLKSYEVNELPSTPADRRIKYGDGPQQFGDLRIPKSKGPHPVAVVIHGGCWKAQHGPKTADLDNTAPLSSALTSVGIVTWNIEYRSTDHPGGGWPGTYDDVAKALDHLRVLAKSYSLDLDRVVIVGHSAGGHLGTWAAGRPRLTRTSELFSKHPLPIKGVVNLAGPVDLEHLFTLRPKACPEGVYSTLIGGDVTGPGLQERLSETSPSALLPIGVPQILITGNQDKSVPPELARSYEEKAKRAGDNVTSKEIENAGHFEVIAPGSVAWPAVEHAVFSLLGTTKASAATLDR